MSVFAKLRRSARCSKEWKVWAVFNRSSFELRIQYQDIDIHLVT